IATSNILTPPPRSERRGEGGGDALEQRRDVGADCAQQGDRDDGNEAENQCVLDQCLTFLGLVAAGDQGDAMKNRCHFSSSLSFSLLQGRRERRGDAL